ncbi:ABC transporter permease [Paenibacillus riograndensis]|uniref:ABC3 transporter permease C-terminal domain-containing protein n=1 Tax=Paenibacillus riograndensis SBR5 TaxID=1073571 RepID=A0A0E4CXS0_9BACL|nr:FtsX-like permease family protein [Paenibacillus riograndensis]CQR56699.1 hypothetical protein PRIO_4297 [Paenibacillus riograndensis SBR5]
MLLQMVKRDIRRNKIISVGLVLFIMLSALLAASATHILVELSGSLRSLLVQAQAPHFVQMHSGPINADAIREFTANNPLVKQQQTQEMLNIDGSRVYLGESTRSEGSSVMDISFVRQNPAFDYLLNLDNQIIEVPEGNIAVPIYYMQQNNLHIGDQVKVSDGPDEWIYTISDFVRDVQMNPSLVSSKRFVVNESDYRLLKGKLGEIEYLIEFQLNDSSRLAEFRNAYKASNLPDKGPNIDYPLLKTLNALTDGIIAIVIIAASMLLIVIACLCLRFTLLATLEEDYREIGVMKAIGISRKDIRKLYFGKYFILAALACCGGYGLSFAVLGLFTSNISLYMGTAPASLLKIMVPIFAAGLIFGLVMFFCRIILGRFGRISAAKALRTGTLGTGHRHNRRYQLSRRKYVHVNIFLGIKDVCRRFSMFGILFVVMVICLFLIIVPVNLLHTLKSPNFISYMGVGQSDLRIDLQSAGDTEQRYHVMLSALKNDPDIERLSPLVTSRFKVLGNDGLWANLNVETGDFSIFPLSYLHGTAPEAGNEIALSDLNARELNKKVGDILILEAGGKKLDVTVSGIYQDITNGGRTAKARIGYDRKNVLWYIVALDLKPGVSATDKMKQYEQSFSSAKITHLDSYLSQTLGNTIARLKLVTGLAIAVSLAVTIMMTSLFLKMLLAKDTSQIAIMKSMGFTHRDICWQYLTKIVSVASIGIVSGTFASGTIGEALVRLLGSMMGASRIELAAQPLLAYLVLPCGYLLTVGLAAIISTLSVKRVSNAQHTAE